MKIETLLKLEKIIKDGNIAFEEAAEGLAVNYELSDEEIKDLVETEYGPTLQDVNQLFEAILKKLVRESLSYAKDNSDKLSDL